MVVMRSIAVRLVNPQVTFSTGEDTFSAGVGASEAPGESILSANGDTTNGYIRLSGTSMACPHVAGVVSILLTQDYGLFVGVC